MWLLHLFVNIYLIFVILSSALRKDKYCSYRISSTFLNSIHTRILYIIKDAPQVVGCRDIFIGWGMLHCTEMVAFNLSLGSVANWFIIAHSVLGYFDRFNEFISFIRCSLTIYHGTTLNLGFSFWTVLHRQFICSTKGCSPLYDILMPSGYKFYGLLYQLEFKITTIKPAAPVKRYLLRTSACFLY